MNTLNSSTHLEGHESIIFHLIYCMKHIKILFQIVFITHCQKTTSSKATINTRTFLTFTQKFTHTLQFHILKQHFPHTRPNKSTHNHTLNHIVFVTQKLNFWQTIIESLFRTKSKQQRPQSLFDYQTIL